MSAAPLSLYLGARRCIDALLRDGLDFDLIDAHYFYPDGVAAVLLGRHYGKPVTITARGSDINVLARYALPRRMIRWAAANADGMIAVCQALKDSLVELGASADRIRVLRNGVDLVTFRPGDRSAARAKLGFAGTVLLSVGNLIPLKGHDLAIRALGQVAGALLVIVGDGPERANLEALARQSGVAERVRFMGRLPHGDLPQLYQAADLLLLLSSNEGMANVLLEAMACGTPAVATNVGGTPEVVASAAVGELVEDRNHVSIAAAVKRILARRPDRAGVRTHAESFSWDATTTGQLQLFREIIRSRQDGAAVPSRK
jgi:glycosyltransferase involved in cell wall biosynthesis